MQKGEQAPARIILSLSFGLLKRNNEDPSHWGPPSKSRFVSPTLYKLCCGCLGRFLAGQYLEDSLSGGWKLTSSAFIRPGLKVLARQLIECSLDVHFCRMQIELGLGARKLIVANVSDDREDLIASDGQRCTQRAKDDKSVFVQS